MDLGKAPDQGTIALILVTAVISSILVGVFLKKIAESILELMLRPLRLLYEFAYRYIAPRNPLSIALRSYRKHVLRSNLTRMENPVGPNLEVPLEHAFAPLKLRTSTTQESIDLFSYAATARRCIVLGGPGTGKTTLMKSLVTSILKKRCHPDLDNSIPVFVVLRNLAKKQHTVHQAIVSAFADHHFPGADKFIQSALDTGKLVIILDGLDEVGASREFVVEQILRFCQYDDQQEHQNRLIVTCREHSYRTMDLREGIPEVVQVEPFTNHHIRVFLEGWPMHKERSAIKLYALIQGDPQIRDICRNPLLLTILTGLYLDTDDFQIPTSRELFYQKAINELLVHRPARRQIRQAFKEDDKRQILERVALERLETVDRAEDPEELTLVTLQKTAEAVLRQGKLDIHDLITELVEINGIIKPISGDSFTCAHRTILEYFAAREAIRRRTTSEVFSSFGGRPELIEVLYFYCGLLENLPALESIVSAFIEQQRWLEAGRSLVHMKEAPNSNSVKEVASRLRDLLVAGVDIKAPIEVLSSMSSRRGLEFEAARPFFLGAIDHLAASAEAGASALESAVATSPDIALKLIPGMLRHSSERWRAAGVRLLRDIGTDEALDQLVQLLTHQDAYVRSQAAYILTGMIRSRNQALRQRATLLPERKDKAVWPLEPFFPGNIAIPIAEALAPDGESESQAIGCAIKALDPQWEHSADPILKRWRRVPLDVTLQRYRRRTGMLLAVCGPALGAVTMISLLALEALAYKERSTVLVRTTTPHIKLIESSFLEQMFEAAGSITQEIEISHPSNATGWRRLISLNEPKIPESSINAYRFLKSWSKYAPRTGAMLREDTLKKLDGLTSFQKLQRLKNAIASLRTQGIFDNETLFSLHPSLSLRALVYLFATLGYCLLPFVLPRFRSSWRIKTYMLAIQSDVEIRRWSLFMSTIAVMAPGMAMALFPPFAFAVVSKGETIMPITLIAMSSPLFGLLFARFPWPKNPLLATVDEVTLHESSIRAEDPHEEMAA